MATSIISLRRTGLSDWLIQRASALVLLTYFILIACQLLGSVDYISWRGLFDQTWMKIFTLLAALSLAAHAWIGLWSVTTDYLTERLLGPKGKSIRLLCQIGTSSALIGYVIWIIVIVWR